MMERLYNSFKNSIHALSFKKLIILIIFSIIIEIFHFFIRILIHFNIISAYHITFLILFMIFSIIFGTILIYIFGKKLFNVIILTRKSINLNSGSEIIFKSPKSQFNTISRMSLNPQQLKILKSMTKSTLLSSLAIFIRNSQVLIYGLTRITEHSIHKKINYNKSLNEYTILIIFYILLNITLFIELFCVYLSFTFFIFSVKWYDYFCGKFHRKLQIFGLKYAQKKLAKINIEIIQSYKLMEEFSLDENYNNNDDNNL